MTLYLWLDAVLFALSLLLGFAASASLARGTRSFDNGIKGNKQQLLRLFPVLWVAGIAGAVLFGYAVIERLVALSWLKWLLVAGLGVLIVSLTLLWPRILGKRNGGRLLTAILWPLALLMWPLWLIIRALAWPFEKLFGVQLDLTDPFLLLPGSTSGDSEEDAAAQQTQEMVGNLADFSETTVKEVMIPRIDVFSLDIDTPLNEIVGEVTQRGHSRVPVYQDTVDNILGLLYTKELLTLNNLQSNAPLGQDFLHAPVFVPETKLIGTLLREFQTTKNHIALVVDEYGGTAGIITMEDILEEIVGEITDEFDEEPELIQEVGRGVFFVDARCDIGELNEELECNLPDEDYESLGGYIIAELEQIPTPGQKLEYEDWQLEVVEASPRRVKVVRMARIDAEKKTEKASESSEIEQNR